MWRSSGLWSALWSGPRCILACAGGSRCTGRAACWRGIVAGAAVLTLLANVCRAPSLGRLDDVLIFNDNWGTYRGTAWRITAESWLAQPVWRKLFGVGPGMMHTAVAQWAGADITDRMKTFYAAHNEYLELLLTTGVAGLAAWLWFVISTCAGPRRTVCAPA